MPLVSVLQTHSLQMFILYDLTSTYILGSGCPLRMLMKVSMVVCPTDPHPDDTTLQHDSGNWRGYFSAYFESAQSEGPLAPQHLNCNGEWTISFPSLGCFE